MLDCRKRRNLSHGRRAFGNTNLKRTQPGTNEVPRNIRGPHQSLLGMSRSSKQIVTQLMGRNSPDRSRRQPAAKVARQPVERNPPDIRIRERQAERWKRHEDHRSHTAARVDSHRAKNRLPSRIRVYRERHDSERHRGLALERLLIRRP